MFNVYANMVNFKGGIWIHWDSLGFIGIHLVSLHSDLRSSCCHQGHLSYCHANSIGGKLVAGDQSGRHCGVQPDAAHPVG